jgi:hypothetical protein
VSIPDPSFDHLLRLTDHIGMFEHAEGIEPRRHLGYCLDDVARALVIVARQPDADVELRRVTVTYLDFVASAQEDDGRFHNRRGPDGSWQDGATVGDWWGRALWGLGTAAARAADPAVRHTALDRFESSAALRSPFPRSMAFAAAGAAEVLVVLPDHPGALGLLRAVPDVIGRPAGDPSWPWPEPRLSYANAALAEALIIVGEHVGDGRALDDGLRMLGWLMDSETAQGHLSVTPVGGHGPEDDRPRFDQQPIEAAALADACVRALRITGDPRWAAGVDAAIGWFLGHNDAGHALCDPVSGGGYDGLERDGCNTNQGAESTLALLSTLQHRRQLAAR